MAATSHISGFGNAVSSSPRRVTANTQSRQGGAGPRTWAFDDFTERARRAVSNAHQEAYRHITDHISTEHLLLGLMDDNAIGETLGALGLSPDCVRRQVEAIIGPIQPARPAHLPYSPPVKKVLERSRREAQLRSHDLVDAEHLLWVLTHGDSAAIGAFATLGVTPARIRRQLQARWER